MSDVGKLVVAMEARTRSFENAMNKALGIAKQNAQAIEARFDKMNNNISASFKKVLGFGTALTGVSLGLSGLKQMADTWSDMKSRITNATGSVEQGAVVMARLREVADRTYSPLEATAESFLKNAQSLKALGYSTQTQLDFTEALNNALVVSATKGDKAAAVQDALGKAMAAGKLSGNNLNTVIENGGRFAQALADSMGINVMELRKYGAEGKITTDVLVGVTSQQKQLRKEAENMPATIADGMTRMGTALLAFIGNLDQASGVSATLAQGMVFLSENMGSVAAAAVSAGTVLLAQNSAYIAGLTKTIAKQALMVATNPYLLLATAIGAAAFALTAFSDQIYPVQGELANLGDYGVAAWEMLKEAAAVTMEAVKKAFSKLIEKITKALDGIGTSWEDVWEVVKTVGNNIIGLQKTVADVVITTFTSLPGAIADGVISAANFMVEKVEGAINAVVAGVNKAIAAINSIGGVVGVSVTEVGLVSLGRIENKFAGAGEAAGKAYSDAFANLTKDHIGVALAEGTAALQGLRDRANQRAEERKNNSGGTVDNKDTPTSVGGGGGGKGGRGGGKGKQDDLQREIEQIKNRTRALQDDAIVQEQVNPLMNDYGYSLAKAEAAQKLLSAAQKAGKEITPELKDNIEQLAEGYAQATAESNRLAESNKNIENSVGDFQSATRGVLQGVISDLKEGKSAAEIFANALSKIGDKLMELALNSFVGGSGGGGIFGMLFKGLFSGFGGGGVGLYADGGFVGDGGKYEPKGVVHGGEFVFSKEAVRRLGVGNLDAMHRNLKGYSSGGFVGSPSIPSPARSAAGGTETVRVVLQDDSGRMAEIADQRIQTKSGSIVEIAVNQSVKNVKRNLNSYAQESQQRYG